MTISKAVILSAGKGSRLHPLTDDLPKCLIAFAGRTLLDWQLDTLIAGGVTDIAIVTGFRDDLVETVARARQGVRTIFNPFYHVADNLGSVWMARAEFDADTLLLNGDTLISPPLLARVLDGACESITVTIDEKPDYDADDMKVLRDGDRLLRIGKALEPGDYNAESIGLLAFKGGGGRIFIDQVERMMRTAEGTRRWYLRAIDALAPHHRIGTVSVRGEDWQEVDFPEDLVKAEALTARWAQAQ